ncbi:MAG: lysophospholipid acyltransferase family protein [Candidatus Methylumidiphilus sp.]
MRPWLKGALIALMFLWGVFAVAVVMPACGWVFGRRAAPIHQAIVTRWNHAVCRILNVRLSIDGQPDPDARLWVSNHVSWLDIIALGSLLPCQFVAKEDVAAWPVIGYLAQGIGTLFVRRGDAGQTSATAELMVWQLRQGKRLLLFPEGTTTTGEKVLRFHGKLFQPAQRAAVVVQAVALRYTGEAAQTAPFIGEDEFLPHLLKLLKAERLDLSVTFCPALPKGLAHGEMASASHRQIAAVVNPGWAERRRASLSQ